MPFEKITESESLYQNLEQQSVEQLLLVINTEDQKVALAVKSILPSIQKLTEQVIRQLKKGGRMIIPVGTRFQTQYLTLVEKDLEGVISTRQILPVYFVPFTGGH